MSTNQDPSSYALRRTAVAAVRGDKGVKVYFQDFDGHIREGRYEYGEGYLGGDKGSIIASADDTKYNGPLASVVSKDPSQSVTLFYISKDYKLRGLLYDGNGWNAFTSLHEQNISVCPSSQLATLRYDNDTQIRLFYQDPSKTLRELSYKGSSQNWTHSTFSLPALVGSSLACEKWLNDNGTLREIQFFYQDTTCEVRSHFYLAQEDEWYYGYLHVPSMPPQCAIAAAAHRHLGYNADVARIYTVEPSGKIAERSWRSDTEEWSHVELTRSMVEGKMAATWFELNDNPEIRLFYLGPDGGLRGYNFQNREWSYEHRVPCGD